MAHQEQSKTTPYQRDGMDIQKVFDKCLFQKDDTFNAIPWTESNVQLVFKNFAQLRRFYNVFGPFVSYGFSVIIIFITPYHQVVGRVDPRLLEHGADALKKMPTSSCQLLGMLQNVCYVFIKAKNIFTLLYTTQCQQYLVKLVFAYCQH